MVVRVPAPNKLKTTQSCSYDTATKPRGRLKHDYDNHIMKHYETQSLHPTWAGCLISTTSLPSLVRAHSNPPKPSPQKPTVPQRNDLTTNKPKPTPFDSCYKCLPFPAHVPTRDRGILRLETRCPEWKVSASCWMFPFPFQEITSLSVAFCWHIWSTKNKLANRAAKIPGSNYFWLADP